jgi:Protein of unknown function (DUF2726)
MFPLLFFPSICWIIILSLLLILLLNRKATGDAASYPFVTRDALLSPAELTFFRALQDGAPSRFSVCPKVLLNDVIESPAPVGSKIKIPPIHLSFVVIDMERARILMALELEDSSSLSRRREEHTFVEDALKKANLRLVRVPESPSYDLGTLWAEVETESLRRAA